MNAEKRFIIGSSFALALILAPTILNAFAVFLLSGAIPGTNISLPANAMLAIFTLALVAASLHLFRPDVYSLIGKLVARRASFWKRLPIKRFRT